MQSRAKHHDLILRQNFSWVLNGFHRLRQVIIEWLQAKGAQLTSEDAIMPLQYLTYLHRCCVPESTLAGLLSNMSLTSTWSQCLCGFLSLENIGRLPSVQVILSRFLCDMTETAKSSQPLTQQLRETLLPVLTEVKDGNSSLQSPESCLWVSFLSYLTQAGYRAKTRLEPSPGLACPASRYSIAIDSLSTQTITRGCLRGVRYAISQSRGFTPSGAE
jgi:serine/threonine-protein kinase ATR